MMDLDLFPKKTRVDQVLKVRKASYKKDKFTAYSDKECAISLNPWTPASYDFDISFNIVEHLDSVFKCAQHEKTPFS